MVSTKLKQYFLYRKVAKLLATYQRTSSVTSKKISSVAILTEEGLISTEELQDKVEAVLNVRNSTMYIYRVFEKEQTASPTHFSEADFKRNGKISDTSLRAFTEHPFDLLVVYIDKPNALTEYLTLLSVATFKVGFANVNPKLFDLEIQTTSASLSIFLEETKKYLTILNKL